MGVMMSIIGFLSVGFVVFMGIVTMLSRRQVTQAIYDLSPETHQQKQTPSFGGVGMVVMLCLGSVWFGWWGDLRSMWVALCFGLFAGIGCLDDGLSAYHGRNKGLSARQKFALQWVVAIGALVGYSIWIDALPLWQVIGYGWVIVGASNAANLTDGLDGLLSGIGCLIFGCLSLYLPQPIWGTMGLILVSFLMVNRYPARLFMGDTGSLGIGAALGAGAVVAGSIWPIVVLGGVLICETLSVMVQVAWYKRTQRRVFLMAPLHHHFELLGLREPLVVGLFWLMQLGFTVVFWWAYL